jgi:hypothetical protein
MTWYRHELSPYQQGSSGRIVNICTTYKTTIITAKLQIALADGMASARLKVDGKQTQSQEEMKQPRDLLSAVYKRKTIPFMDRCPYPRYAT